MEHCMRQTVIALRLADLAGADEREREATYYLGLMMNAYCHADAAGLRRLPPHAADHRPADHGRFHHHRARQVLRLWRAQVRRRHISRHGTVRVARRLFPFGYLVSMAGRCVPGRSNVDGGGGVPRSTICRPSGQNATGTSLKLAMPNGIPMIVRHSTMPAVMWASASHQPASRTQRMLAMPDATPASGRLTTVRPNGHSAYPARRIDAMPNGMVTISAKQTRAARPYPIASSTPLPKISQRMLRMKRTNSA